MKKLIYWWKKLLYGECPECHVILVYFEGWDFGYCSRCGRHYK